MYVNVLTVDINLHVLYVYMYIHICIVDINVYIWYYILCVVGNILLFDFKWLGTCTGDRVCGRSSVRAIECTGDRVSGRSSVRASA